MIELNNSKININIVIIEVIYFVNKFGVNNIFIVNKMNENIILFKKEVSL
jgi:hypothetical protein